MGCWNETCGVSNLDIEYGDPVRLILLEQDYGAPKEYTRGFCYADDLWRPRLLPVKGKYDGYGRIEEVEENLNTKIIVHDLINVEPFLWEGDPQGSTGLMDILHRAERGLLEIPSEEIRIGQVLVLEEVYQCVVEIGNITRSASARQFDEMLGARFLAETYSSKLMAMGVPFNPKFGSSEKVEEEKSVAELRSLSGEFRNFRRGMNVLRKFFSPQSGKGSQETNGAYLLRLNSVVRDIFQKRESEREGENGGD